MHLPTCLCRIAGPGHANNTPSIDIDMPSQASRAIFQVGSFVCMLCKQPQIRAFRRSELLRHGCACTQCLHACNYVMATNNAKHILILMLSTFTQTSTC